MCKQLLRELQAEVSEHEAQLQTALSAMDLIRDGGLLALPPAMDHVALPPELFTRAALLRDPSQGLDSIDARIATAAALATSLAGV